MRRLFSLFDCNGDGIIGLEEMQFVMHALDKEWTHERVARLFRDVDANNDGELHAQEFLDWIFAGGEDTKSVMRYAKTSVTATEMTPQLADILQTVRVWAGYNDVWSRKCEEVFNKGGAVTCEYNPFGTSAEDLVLKLSMPNGSTWKWHPEDGVPPIERDVRSAASFSRSSLGGWAWGGGNPEVQALEPEHEQLPPFAWYTWTSAGAALDTVKTMPGLSTSADGPSFDDRLEDFGIVAVEAQGRYWMDGRHNSSNWKVELGTVEGGGNPPIRAFMVHEPANRATELLMSEHVASFRVRVAGQYTVYKLCGNEMEPVQDLPVESPDRFVAALSVKLSSLEEKTILCLVPSTQTLSPWNQVAVGVGCASLGKWPLPQPAEVLKYRYSVRGKPFDNVGRTPGRHFAASPFCHQNVYSHPRTWHPVATSGGPGVVWQSFDDDWTPHLSLFVGGDFASHEQVELPGAGSGILAAAASDAEHVYLLLVQRGNGKPGGSRKTVVIKADLQGNQVARAAFAGNQTGLGPNQVDLNVTVFYDDCGSNMNVASMEVQGNNLGVILGRTMHRTPDGLNHQGAIAFVLSTRDLRLIKHHGQTSGHSFDSVLTAAGGALIGADLGDNFPRGINLHRFNHETITSKVVYTFKTKHGTSAQSPAGVDYQEYSSIGSAGRTYFAWSNDNCTYTELGGVVQVGDSILVAFAGEGSPSEGCLDNSNFSSEHTCRGTPRNLGLVVVRGDFGSNQLIDDVVSSRDHSTYEQNGGFFTFQGTWRQQRVVGVRWYTNYAEDENVSRVRIVRLHTKSPRIVILWEKWTRSYISTFGIEVDYEGTPVAPPFELGPTVRLGRRDEALATPCGNLLLFQGDGTFLEMTVLSLSAR